MQCTLHQLEVCWEAGAEMEFDGPASIRGKAVRGSGAGAGASWEQSGGVARVTPSTCWHNHAADQILTKSTNKGACQTLMGLHHQGVSYKQMNTRENKRENLKRLGENKWLLKHFWSNQIWIRLPEKFRGNLLIFSIILCFYYVRNVCILKKPKLAIIIHGLRKWLI